MKVLQLIVLNILGLSLGFSQIEILNGSEVIKCGDDSLILRARTGPDITDLEWYISGGFIQDPIGYGETYIVTNANGRNFESFELRGKYNGIEDSDEVVVIFQRKPAIDVGNDTSFCKGGEATFVETTTITAGYTYLWNTGDSTNAITVDTSGTFILKKTGPFPRTCFSYDTVNLDVFELPDVSISAIDSLCGEGTFQINTEFSQPSSDMNVQWSPSALLSSDTVQNPTVDFDGQSDFFQEYFVTVTNKITGCAGNTDSVVLKGFKRPELILNESSDSLYLCDQDNTTIEITNYDAVSNIYRWVDVVQNDVVNTSNQLLISQNTELRIQAEGITSGCFSDRLVKIAFGTSPSGLVWSAPDSLPNDEVLRLYLNGYDGDAELQWYTDGVNELKIMEGTDTAFVYESVQSDVGDINFTIQAENECGVDSTSTTVYFIQTIKEPSYIVYLPNSLQPSNQDPEVSRFKVYGENVDDDNFDFYIFNNRGQVIFESHSFEEMNTSGWDGGEYPANIYMYSLEAQYINGDPLVEQGTITLLR